MPEGPEPREGDRRDQGRACRAGVVGPASSSIGNRPGGTSMIDHVGFPVSDYARSKAFYEQALAPLGYVVVMEVLQHEHDAKACGFGRSGKPDFWIGGERGVGRAPHIAITAKDRARVGTFFKAALAAGGGGKKGGSARCISPSRRTTAPVSTRSTRLRLRRVGRTMAGPASARTIIRTIMPPSCSIPMDTISRRCAAREREGC